MMGVDRFETYCRIVEDLKIGKDNDVRRTLISELPFEILPREHRSYSIGQKLRLFFRDGFIDRYSGEKLLNPGFLRVLSDLFPKEFPYHLNWKQTECHQAWWMRYPTVDHLIPIARGGKNEPDNWITTSMLHNQAKLNWTIEELGWKLHEPGRIEEWDGLSASFLVIVEARTTLLNDKYIRDWYHATKKILGGYK